MYQNKWRQPEQERVKRTPNTPMFWRQSRRWEWAARSRTSCTIQCDPDRDRRPATGRIFRLRHRCLNSRCSPLWSTSSHRSNWILEILDWNGTTDSLPCRKSDPRRGGRRMSKHRKPAREISYVNILIDVETLVPNMTIFHMHCSSYLYRQKTKWLKSVKLTQPLITSINITTPGDRHENF